MTLDFSMTSVTKSEKSSSFVVNLLKVCVHVSIKPGFLFLKL